MANRKSKLGEMNPSLSGKIKDFFSHFSVSRIRNRSTVNPVPSTSSLKIEYKKAFRSRQDVVNLSDDVLRSASARTVDPSSKPQQNLSSRTTNSETIQKKITVEVKPLCCDKCDGKHDTSACPYYKKDRDTHPDAQKNAFAKLGGISHLPGNTIRFARVVRQPGDGSCLFHSISYGLGGISANRLRSEVTAFIKENPSYSISETPLKEWVRWDSGSSVDEYCRRMASGSWGGGIEMACVSRIKKCNIHVYESSFTGYKRISAFDFPESPENCPTVRILYCGGVHYNALVV